MRKSVCNSFAALAALTMALPAPLMAQEVSINFGDDSGRFSKDGECDDMRFDGAGMTSTLLIDSDVFHDATDCRTAYNQGRLRYLGGRRGNSTPSAPARTEASRIQWGDDSSRFSKDGECDDKRFVGAGMTSTPLIDSDIKHDATDCRAAYTQGRLELRQ